MSANLGIRESLSTIHLASWSVTSIGCKMCWWVKPLMRAFFHFSPSKRTAVKNSFCSQFSFFPVLHCVYLICCRVFGHCWAPRNIFHRLYPWFPLAMRNWQIPVDGCTGLRCSTTRTHIFTVRLYWQKQFSLKYVFYLPPSPSGNQNQWSWGLSCYHRIQTWAAAGRRVLNRSSSPTPYVSQ